MPKILIIIPAHNEAKNIGSVLDEIKKTSYNVDILVINDCSNDNTKLIIQQKGIEYITNTFNLHYAWSIQTGIKYAKYHNYDYCILMDADGQHLASEIAKLYNTIISTDSDIVIGSRYLKKSNYGCPAFRKIGTKLFSHIIKLFTGQKITDPLSGFQCINRKVINFWSECGNYPEYPDASPIIEMISRGYKVTEVAVQMKNREHGTSMHAGLLKPIKYVVTQLYTCVIILIKYIGRRKVK